MAKVSAGWALELRGDDFDLNDLRGALRAPFDPWVEEYEREGATLLLLRSSGWSGMDTTAEMMADARRLVDQINAAHLVEQPDAEPITYGQTLRFDQDGKEVPFIIAGTLHMQLKGVRARFTLCTGQPVNTEPQPSQMQQRLNRAVNDDNAADALGFIARADNWFDLYKAMECLEQIAGGVNKVKAMDTAWKDVRQTANVHRHAPSPKSPLPKSPPTFEQARAVVLRVSAKLL